MELDDITQYRSIAWDFDQTLYGHERSNRFWTYIHDNPHHQKHFIVTFRTARLFNNLWHDLGEARCPLLPLHFQGVHGVPDNLYEAFVLGLTGGNRYLFWKGKLCLQLGIECLVDDATLHVWPGCSKYGIAYVHPNCARF